MFLNLSAAANAGRWVAAGCSQQHTGATLRMAAAAAAHTHTRNTLIHAVLGRIALAVIGVKEPLAAASASSTISGVLPGELLFLSFFLDACLAGVAGDKGLPALLAPPIFSDAGRLEEGGEAGRLVHVCVRA